MRNIAAGVGLTPSAVADNGLVPPTGIGVIGQALVIAGQAVVIGVVIEH
jgi:hypothetical protein